MQQVRTTPPYSIPVAQNYRYFATKISEKIMSRKTEQKKSSQGKSGKKNQVEQNVAKKNQVEQNVAK